MADTGACSEMTHYILIALRPAAGAGGASRDKGQSFAPLTWLA